MGKNVAGVGGRDFGEKKKNRVVLVDFRFGRRLHLLSLIFLPLFCDYYSLPLTTCQSLRYSQLEALFPKWWRSGVLLQKKRPRFFSFLDFFHFARKNHLLLSLLPSSSSSSFFFSCFFFSRRHLPYQASPSSLSFFFLISSSFPLLFVLEQFQWTTRRRKT